MAHQLHSTKPTIANKGRPNFVDGLSETETKGRHDRLVVLGLVHLKELRNDVVGEFKNLSADCAGLDKFNQRFAYSAEETNRVKTSDPRFMVAQIVEGSDDLEKRINSTLPDPFIVVVEQGNQLNNTGLDERKEMATGGSEDCTDCVSCNFLFDSDGTVDIHELLEVKILNIVSVEIFLKGDGVGGRFSRRKRCRCVTQRD